MPQFIPFAKSLSRWLGWLMVFVILLVALLTVLVRQLLPAVSEYRPEIEQYLSEQLHTPVTLEHISASWQGRFPTLLLQGVSIADHPSQTVGAVAVDQLILGLNPVSSLIQWQPVLSRVEIWALQTAVELPEATAAEPGSEAVASTAEAVAGIDGPTVPLAVADPLAILWLQPHIFFYDTRIDLHFPSGESVQLSAPQLNLENSARQHHFRGEVLLRQQEAETALTFMLESDSQTLDFQQARFDFYMKMAGVDHRLLARVREIAPVPAGLEQLQLGGELWGHWSAGRIDSVQGTLAVDSLLINPDPTAQAAVAVDNLSSQVALLQQADHYQLQLTALQATINGAPLVLPQVVIDTQQNRLTGVSLSALQLPQIAQLVQQQPLIPDAVKSELAALNLAGAVHNIQLRWPLSQQPFDIKQFVLLADLERVAFSAAHGAPEMAGVTGRLEMEATAATMAGRIDLQSDGLELFFPEVYEQGWRYDRARGVIHWRLAEQILTLRSELLELHKPGIEARGRWSLHLPLTPETQSELTLLIGLQDSDGTLAPELIPQKIVSKPLQQWVADSIKQGHLNQGGFMLRTGTRNLASLQPPVVQLFLNIDDANVAYQPGWPAVEGAQANVLLRDTGVEVDISAGQLLNSRLEHVWVYLPPGSTQLAVLGQVQGDAADIQTTLLQSPVFDGSASELALWQLAGPAETALTLSLPLQGGGQPNIDVLAELNQGSLQSVQRGLAVTELAGQVGYHSDRGLYAKALTGQFFGYPLQAQIRTDRQKKGQRIRTTLKSRINMQQLRDWSGIELLRQAEGVQSYQAVLDLCTATDCSALTVTSDLAKTALNLLPPYSKSVGKPMPFQLVTDFASPQTLNFKLGSKLRGQFELQAGAIRRGTLTLGGSAAQLRDRPGLFINGDIDRLQYSDLERLLTVLGVFDALPSAAEAGRTASAKTPAYPNTVVQLSIGDFRYENIQLLGVSTHLEKQNEHWLLSAMNVDMDGVLRLPNAADEPYQLVFGNLNLDRLQRDTPAPSESTILMARDSQAGVAALQPGGLPDFDISVSNLVLKAKQWGGWSFKVRNSPGKTSIEDIRGRLEQLQINGQMDWLPDMPSRSEMYLTLQAQDLGQSLASAGFPRALETEAFSADLQMGWTGAPWQYALEQVDGSAQFLAEKGRLIEAGQATGFLRVFGILNMNALGRRMRLDFKDLFEKGVSFDKMSGDYRIKKGVAQTKTPFVMRGPSVDMTLAGELDLVAETVDKQIAVTLPVTDNIPLAAFLLGAPQVAGAAFLLDKLVGDQLKKELATVRYTMRGDWSDPQVTLLQAQPSEAVPVEQR